MLLKQGLHAYSWEIGALRRGFGLVSNDYGPLLAVGTYRAGLTEHFTSELRAEILEDRQALGIGSVFAWPSVGVFSAAFAASNSKPQTGALVLGEIQSNPGGTGGLLAMSFQGQHQWLSYGFSTQMASPRFTQAGQELGASAVPRTTQIFLGASSNRRGSLSLSYVVREQREAPATKLISANYGFTLGSLGFLSASALRIMGAEAESIYGLSFTRLLGSRTTASVSATMSHDRTDGTLRLQRSLPSGDGIGYRIAAGVGDSDRQQATLNLQNRIGTYALEAGSSQGKLSYRGSASGGIAMLGNDAFLSRRISSSFAVVRVPGYPNIGIYQDNQPVARTDAQGIALISRLRPYQANMLRIEQTDLPMNAQIGSLALKAVPYFRSGLALAFDVKRSRGAEFQIVLDDGEAAPAGATVIVNEQPEPYPVGMRGMLYATGLNLTNRIVLEWLGQRCEFSMDFPESDDPLPDLGSYKCSGVTR
jgi:outer membrane usher protein